VYISSTYKPENVILHFRCNPGAAPRLTSGGYADTVDVITPHQHIVHRGWRILTNFDPSCRYSWCYNPNQLGEVQGFQYISVMKRPEPEGQNDHRSMQRINCTVLQSGTGRMKDEGIYSLPAPCTHLSIAGRKAKARNARRHAVI
jgi:hypothetical protein